jgi:hypothetical protein
MPERMVRKQIYLPRRQNLTLKRLAKQPGISEAEVIRQALEGVRFIHPFADEFVIEESSIQLKT